MNNYRTIVLLRMFCLLMITSGVISPKVLLAQTKRIDSLLILIKPEKADTNQVLLLLDLSDEYRNYGLLDKELLYCNKAIALCNSIVVDGKMGWPSGLAKAYSYRGDHYFDGGNLEEGLRNYKEALKAAEQCNNDKRKSIAYTQIGTICYYQSKFSTALEFYELALNIALRLNLKKNAADNYINIGNVHFIQNSYSNALNNYLKGLQIAIEIDDKSSIASSYINIGNIYQTQKNYDDAVTYYLKALKINQEQNNKDGIANVYLNIGNCYMAKSDFAAALTSFYKAQRLAENINNKILLAYSCVCMADTYEATGQYEAAFSNYTIALNIYYKLNSNLDIASTYLKISRVYKDLGKSSDAYEYLLKAKAIGEEIHSKEILKQGFYLLSQLDSLQNNWEQAYKNHTLFTLYKDSIENEESFKKTLQATISFEYKLKQAEIEADRARKDAVATTQRKQQQIILILVSGLLFLTVILSFFIFRSLKNARKQKLLIEEKNKDIIDSINYAKRIQDALLRNETQAGELLPEHFIFNCPKDIVSGDFYWSIQKNDYWYFAVADCTGHGVPGGFMSMLGIAFLNEITAHIELPTPAQILNLLRDKIVEELQQNENNINKDGMDISLIRYHIKTRALQWAGANNALYIISKNGFKELKPDKQPIGFYLVMPPFTNHELQMEKGDMLYLFTDGYSDQFGGEKGRKFLSKQLKELLNSIAALPLAEQKQVLATTFDNWKNGFEQVDDVCIAGILI